MGLGAEEGQERKVRDPGLEKGSKESVSVTSGTQGPMLWTGQGLGDLTEATQDPVPEEFHRWHWCEREHFTESLKCAGPSEDTSHASSRHPHSDPLRKLMAFPIHQGEN